MLRILAIILIAILALIGLWHVFFPLLGAAIGITVTLWVFIFGSVIAFCVAILLLFVITGVGLLFLGMGAIAWAVMAILLFPFLFPIIVPLLLVVCFLIFAQKMLSKKKSKNDSNLIE